MDNQRNHEIVEKSLEMLRRLDHRGGIGADGVTGDGAGIMTEVPYEYFAEKLNLIYRLKVNMRLECFY